VVEDPGWPRASDWLAGNLEPGGGVRGLAVIGVPLSQTSISVSEAHETPAAVRTALRRFPTYGAALDVNLEDLTVIDHGDLDVAALSGEAAIAAVREGLACLPPADLVILIGGDNAITRPGMRALLPPLSRCGLVTLDAHHDVRGFHAGATNGTPVRGLIEDGLPGKHVVQIGIADWSNSLTYRRYCEQHGIGLVSAREATREGAGTCVRRALDGLAARCEAIYVDLDVDVVDSAFVPGCPGARPGGLLPADLLDAAREAGRHPRVRAVDIVEVDAARDPSGPTVDLAAMCLLSAAEGLAAR
jgi:arginase family enzyme